MLKRALSLLAILFFFAIPAFSQTTTVTGTVKDLTGAVVTSGYVTFTLQPGVSTTIAGNAAFVPTLVTCGINGSGQIQNQALSGSCVVSMNTAILPAGTYYKVTFQPYGVTSAVINFYAYLSSQDVTTTVPTPGTMPAYSFMDLATNQTIGGVKTFSAQPVFSAGITGSGNMGSLAAGTGILGAANIFTSPQSVASGGIFSNSQMNDYLSASLNSCSSATEYAAEQGTGRATEPVMGCVAAPNTSTVVAANGIAGFANSNSTTTFAVGAYVQGRALANGVTAWGINPLAASVAGLTSGATLLGGEFDLDIFNTADNGNGIILTGNGRVANTNFTGIQVQYGIGGNPVFDIGYQCNAGAVASGTCLVMSPQSVSGANAYSQTINMTGRDSGGVAHTAQFGADPNGAVVAAPASGQPFYPGGSIQLAAGKVVLSGQANPAQSGIFRCAASDTCLGFRNNANTADVVLALSTTDQYEVGGNPLLHTGNGSGSLLQTARVAGCSTGSTAGSNCGTAITVTWTNAFADTNYTATCTGDGLASGVPSGPYIVTKSAGSMTVNYFAITAAAAAYTDVDCRATHD